MALAHPSVAGAPRIPAGQASPSAAGNWRRGRQEVRACPPRHRGHPRGPRVDGEGSRGGRWRGAGLRSATPARCERCATPPAIDAVRDADYRGLMKEIHDARSAARGEARDKSPQATAGRASSARLRKRLAEIVALDFFGADGRAAAEAALAELEAYLMRTEQRTSRAAASKTPSLKELRGKTWVTRRNVHVDRIACAWFIRRFIDPAARFKFVDPAGYAARRNELRFDMADGEFTHRGDQCSLEVLLAQSGRRDPALQAIAEIVHDLDLKDGKFGRPEVEGLRQLLSGIALASANDNTRLERGGMLFDDLYRSLQGKPALRAAQRRSKLAHPGTGR